jgi:hypothetical protein
MTPKGLKTAVLIFTLVGAVFYAAYWALSVGTRLKPGATAWQDVFVAIREAIPDHEVKKTEPQSNTDVPITPNTTTLPADEILWLTIKDSNVTPLFEEFLRNFPASGRAQEARKRVAELTKKAVSTGQPQKAASPKCLSGYTWHPSSVNPDGECWDDKAAVTHTCPEGQRWSNATVGCIGRVISVETHTCRNPSFHWDEVEQTCIRRDEDRTKGDLTEAESQRLHDFAVRVLEAQKSCQAGGGKFSQRTGKCDYPSGGDARCNFDGTVWVEQLQRCVLRD